MVRAVFAVLLAAFAAPGLTAQGATRFRESMANRLPTAVPLQPTPGPPIWVRATAQLGGQQVSILFNPVPNASEYTLRRSLSAAGPFTALGRADFSFNTRNPACCELIDLSAYKTGPSHPIWYIVDAWAGPSLLTSSAPVQYDLPGFFKGPLKVDLARTGTAEWTVGWELEPTATSYQVLVQQDGGTTNTYSNTIPAGAANQVKLKTLNAGNKYRVTVSAVIPYQGSQTSRSGMTWYTAP